MSIESIKKSVGWWPFILGIYFLASTTHKAPATLACSCIHLSSSACVGPTVFRTLCSMSKKEEKAFKPKGHLISLFPSIPDVTDKNQMTLTRIQTFACGSAIQNNKWATRGCPISLFPSQQQSLKTRPEFFPVWFVGCKLIIDALCWCKENEFRSLSSTFSSPTTQMHPPWLPLANPRHRTSLVLSDLPDQPHVARTGQES